MNRGNHVHLLLVVLMSLLAGSPSISLGASIEETGREAARILGDLVRLDTTNPPGNESLVADYLSRLFEREGIAYQRLARDEGRDNVIARLQGSGKGRPILLYSHSDVVPADPGWGTWTVNPFSGEVRDGYLYGRGAIDAKGLLVCHLMALLELHRNKVKLDRDVIFLAAASEETGSGPGVLWLLRNHPEVIDAEVAFGEGGRVWASGDTVWGAWVQAGEKSAHNLTVTAIGDAGHASVPRGRNAAGRLARAIARIEELDLPERMNPVSEAFLEIMGPLDRRLEEGKPRFEAITRSTVTVTSLQSGVKSNVIPPFAEANLNLRLLPGENLAEITTLIEEAAHEPGVTVRHKPGVENGASLVSFETPFFETISSAIHAHWPEAAVAPYLSPGTSDASKLRAAGILAYGLMPFPMSRNDSRGVHGVDERVRLDYLTEGVSLTYSIVRRWAEIHDGKSR